ncbi:hypothetical protein H0V99_03735 [Candidatus Saccharibacteria bacterium]|nr:hypothetical protein [Candidatus Saccharibacteria bacterium]
MNPDEHEPSRPVEPATPPVEPKQVILPPKKSFLTPLIIALVLFVLFIAGAFIAVLAVKQDDEVPPAANQSEQNASDLPLIEADTIPAGFKEYKNEAASLSFAYPETWGEVIFKQGEEERMKHLTKGSQKILTFSQNDTVVAGIMSVDWTHDPEMGHGGFGEAGIKSLDDAKQAKENAPATNIFVDTNTQFAYVTYCADMCSDVPKTRLLYTVTIPGNTVYEVIQFYQDGDPLGAEFETEDGLTDYEKLEDADLSQLFKKTDSRFLILQQLAGTIKNV